jgi:hypothetical protein
MPVSRADSARHAANAGGRGRAFWSEERLALVLACAAAGLSMQEAARRVGAGCTKGMVSRLARDRRIEFRGHALAARRRRAHWLRRRMEAIAAELAAIEAATEDPDPSSRVACETGAA